MNEKLMIEYRKLSAEEISPAMFAHFQRRQEVTRCWRKLDGQWVIRPTAFVEDWTEKDHEFVAWCLGNILASGGLAAGAFQNGELKGVVSVENTPLGSRGQYREMSGLWVSQEMRGQGIGRKLLEMAKAFAREQGAEKLYISSHSSVESQAFYKAMGCVEAEEYSREHVQREPRHCQIECSVSYTGARAPMVPLGEPWRRSAAIKVESDFHHKEEF